MSDTEKNIVDHVDSVDSPSMHEFTPAEQKSIIRRIDRRLVVTVGFMYCISLMDRTNMGAAIIAGMDKDLDLVNNNRYVRLLSLILSPFHFQLSLITPLEHRQLGLFHHVHHLPASFDHFDPRHWSSQSLVHHHPALGFRHHLHGFLQRLQGLDWSSSSSGGLGGGFLPFLRLLAQHMVHSM